MAAPDFTKSTIDVLAARAAYRCSNPDCDILTVGPHTTEEKSLKIGEAAHIYGARPSERRYRPEMTDLGRASISNAIWLCRNCHGKIDKDPGGFSDSLLFIWKDAHEEKILKELGTDGDRLKKKAEIQQTEVYREFPQFIQAIIRDKPDYWEYILTAELIDFYCGPILRHGADLEKGIVIRPKTLISGDNFTPWILTKVDDLLAVSRATHGLLAEFQSSWGESGVPGDVDEIIHVCRLYGGLVRHIVNTAEEVMFARVPDGFAGAAEVIASAPLHMLKRFPELPAFLRTIGTGDATSGTLKFDFVLEVPEGWNDNFEIELAKGQRELEVRGHW
ncbi:hypothetical protein [Brucella pituitosa]|uniref:hypothetical protein n=1 Tax=Brucella pituitosa TaxID=571256 RepID=UPI003F4AF7C8